MSELSITLLRFGFLILLWALVLAAIGVLRADLYGTRVTSRGRGRAARRRDDARADKVAAPARSNTGVRTGSISTRDETLAHLAVTAGTLKGTTIPLGSAPILIGRSPTCTLVIDDDYCSARHCRVFPDAGGWLVEDLGSTNGTFLDNQRVDDPMPFKRGDKLRLGGTTLELRS
ncbi:FHA domain-containing protein FhaB/FipA [Demequina muriae]|uniref:FHA domain-containing protein n=1 Tax=Demequina muriae TaxID=3051664 RepID=A0ABT8GGI0_9MICO|nr:FHA domain-containing protein [Demequina sp. EGI L300058]MDN4480545.1 FHA domain-containing protein [Demequina sp. EGI L300058]